MRAHYEAPVSEFLAHDVDSIVGWLSTTADQAGAEITAEQLTAWRQQVAILNSALRLHSSCNWHLLMEYPIPRRGKRIDAILLAEDLILVFEFKCGARKYERKSQAQVEDYCLDLRDFHSESRGRVLVPILVATHAEERSPILGEVVDSLAPAWLANEQSLERILDQITVTYHAPSAASIDPSRWDAADYSPTPTIVEAARALYEGHNVHEITRCHGGAENLTKTSAAVMEAIAQARRQGHKLICFVTGVPALGKHLLASTSFTTEICMKDRLGHFSLGTVLL